MASISFETWSYLPILLLLVTRTYDVDKVMLKSIMKMKLVVQAYRFCPTWNKLDKYPEARILISIDLKLDILG